MGPFRGCPVSGIQEALCKEMAYDPKNTAYHHRIEKLGMYKGDCNHTKIYHNVDNTLEVTRYDDVYGKGYPNLIGHIPVHDFLFLKENRFLVSCYESPRG